MEKLKSEDKCQKEVSLDKELYDLEIKIDQVVQALKLIRRYSGLRVPALDAVIEGLEK